MASFAGRGRGRGGASPMGFPGGGRGPGAQAELCYYFQQGFCKRGDQCFYRHERPPSSGAAHDSSFDSFGGQIRGTPSRVASTAFGAVPPAAAHASAFGGGAAAAQAAQPFAMPAAPACGADEGAACARSSAFGGTALPASSPAQPQASVFAQPASGTPASRLGKQATASRGQPEGDEAARPKRSRALGGADSLAAAAGGAPGQGARAGGGGDGGSMDAAQGATAGAAALAAAKEAAAALRSKLEDKQTARKAARERKGGMSKGKGAQPQPQPQPQPRAQPRSTPATPERLAAAPLGGATPPPAGGRPAAAAAAAGGGGGGGAEGAGADAGADDADDADADDPDFGSAGGWGTCLAFCPPEEVAQRQEEIGGIHPFEQDTAVGGPRLDWCVTTFHRLAAGNAIPPPERVRPVHVLRRVVRYLLDEVLTRTYLQPDGRVCPFPKAAASWPQPGRPLLIDRYNFIRDRLRAVRQEVQQQWSGRTPDGQFRPLSREAKLCAVDIFERCARFHILAEHHLCELGVRNLGLDEARFDAKMNMEQLSKTIVTLNEHYEELSRERIGCPNEAEFRSYNMLVEGDTSLVLSMVAQMDEDMRCSAHVRFALRVIAARETGDYSGFMRLLRSANFFAACLMHRFLQTVRAGALERICFAFSGATALPLAELVRILAFADAAEADEFCTYYGLQCEGGCVKLLKTRALQQGEGFLPLHRSPLIEAKVQGRTLSSVVLRPGRVHAAGAEPAPGAGKVKRVPKPGAAIGAGAGAAAACATLGGAAAARLPSATAACAGAAAGLGAASAAAAPLPAGDADAAPLAPTARAPAAQPKPPAAATKAVAAEPAGPVFGGFGAAGTTASAGFGFGEPPTAQPAAAGFGLGASSAAAQPQQPSGLPTAGFAPSAAGAAPPPAPAAAAAPPPPFGCAALGAAAAAPPPKPTATGFSFGAAPAGGAQQLAAASQPGTAACAQPRPPAPAAAAAGTPPAFSFGKPAAQAAPAGSGTEGGAAATPPQQQPSLRRTKKRRGGEDEDEADEAARATHKRALHGTPPQPSQPALPASNPFASAAATPCTGGGGGGSGGGACQAAMLTTCSSGGGGVFGDVGATPALPAGGTAPPGTLGSPFAPRGPQPTAAAACDLGTPPAGAAAPRTSDWAENARAAGAPPHPPSGAEAAWLSGAAAGAAGGGGAARSPPRGPRSLGLTPPQSRSPQRSPFAGARQQSPLRRSTPVPPRAPDAAARPFRMDVSERALTPAVKQHPGWLRRLAAEPDGAPARRKLLLSRWRSEARALRNERAAARARRAAQQLEALAPVRTARTLAPAPLGGAAHAGTPAHPLGAAAHAGAQLERALADAARASAALDAHEARRQSSPLRLERVVGEPLAELHAAARVDEGAAEEPLGPALWKCALLLPPARADGADGADGGACALGGWLGARLRWRAPRPAPTPPDGERVLCCGAALVQPRRHVVPAAAAALAGSPVEVRLCCVREVVAPTAAAATAARASLAGSSAVLIVASVPLARAREEVVAQLSALPAGARAAVVVAVDAAALAPEHARRERDGGSRGARARAARPDDGSSPGEIAISLPGEIAISLAELRAYAASELKAEELAARCADERVACATVRVLMPASDADDDGELARALRWLAARAPRPPALALTNLAELVETRWARAAAEARGAGLAALVGALNAAVDGVQAGVRRVTRELPPQLWPPPELAFVDAPPRAAGGAAAAAPSGALVVRAGEGAPGAPAPAAAAPAAPSAAIAAIAASALTGKPHCDRALAALRALRLPPLEGAALAPLLPARGARGAARAPSAEALRAAWIAYADAACGGPGSSGMPPDLRTLIELAAARGAPAAVAARGEPAAVAARGAPAPLRADSALEQGGMSALAAQRAEEEILALIGRSRLASAVPEGLVVVCLGGGGVGESTAAAVGAAAGLSARSGRRSGSRARGAVAQPTPPFGVRSPRPSSPAEVAARGLGSGEERVPCWAVPRPARTAPAQAAPPGAATAADARGPGAQHGGSLAPGAAQNAEGAATAERSTWEPPPPSQLERVLEALRAESAGMQAAAAKAGSPHGRAAAARPAPPAPAPGAARAVCSYSEPARRTPLHAVGNCTSCAPVTQPSAGGAELDARPSPPAPDAAPPALEAVLARLRAERADWSRALADSQSEGG